MLAQHTETPRVRRVAITDSEREFERLYRQSYALVYNYVCYRMPGSAAVEDVVSEAFLSAARNFHRYDASRSKFSTWVVAIAKNCVNSYYRKARATVVLDEVPEGAAAIGGEQDAADDREFAQQLLRVLDDDERDLVFRKYYLGMRNVEIAEELDINASTISTRLARALSKMRQAAGQ